ncbi:cobaltochelatase subunit CobN [Chloroflexi bacterium TSY]|nr:cobaltochelatase subunit CobN [Chloroflexi bacterium TSY]
MLAADRYLPPPAEVAAHVFNGFAWDGAATEQTEPESEPSIPVDQTDHALARLKSTILLLTHGDTDLLVLSKAKQTLPAEFPVVRGINLMSLPTEAHVQELIRTELDDVQVIVLRSWGGQQGFIHGFDQIVQAAYRRQIDLICIPGTDGLDPELASHSTVSIPVSHDVYAYLHYGGVENMVQMLQFLADHLMAGGWGYEQPREMPRHGVYRGSSELSVQSYPLNTADVPSSISSVPTIGVLFYRSHFLSGNTEFVDALVAAIEEAGGRALPVYTASLKELHGDDKSNQHSEAFQDDAIHHPPSAIHHPAAFEYFYDDQNHLLVDCVISTISFALGGINNEGVTLAGWNVQALEVLGVPVLQAITSGMEQEAWSMSQRGLRPLDVAMNVALPEFDGRIITVPVSFKGLQQIPPEADADNLSSAESINGTASAHRSQYRAQGSVSTVTTYVPVNDRVKAVAQQALRHAKLRRKQNSEKRIAFVLTNSPGKADRIGNAVGLDTPASLMHLLAQMKEQGYVIDDLPADGDALLHELIDRCSYDETFLTETQLARAAGRVPVTQYNEWFAALPASQQSQISERWLDPPGEAYVHLDPQGHNQHIALAGLDLGNVFVALQPPRGYGMDPDAIYHTPDLPPPHSYYALYKWLVMEQAAGGWGADAIVHMGKHGTLEWLPGKGVGLSGDCFPDSFLADLPLIYPFIINNPGEGAQAKRRAHAVIIDHMIPPMTSADVYGELALLTQLVDEYYQVEQMDPAKLPLIQKQIWELMQQTNLDKDIAEMMRTIDHGDHTHEWDGSYTDDGTPLPLAEMSGIDFAHLLEDIDGYLCELGSLQIRDGLHILGQIPEGDQLCHLLRALTRIPNGDVPSLRASVAAWLGHDLDVLLENRGQRVDGRWWLVASREIDRTCVTNADVIELIDGLCLRLFQKLDVYEFNADQIESTISEILPDLHGCVSAKLQIVQNAESGGHEDGRGNHMGSLENYVPPDLMPLRTVHQQSQSKIVNCLNFVCNTLVPLIRQNDAEIDNLLAALNGCYVPAGPAGAPTRGMAHILPTGRNFYAVDPRAIPSQAAWRVGSQLADELLNRYLEEEGSYPESVGLSIWGTSAMRTHGDDIAQCFALLGVRPLWQAESRRIQNIEMIPLDQLGRPRIDVLMRISGFFRDAFPHLIDLLDQAVQTVANLDEPLEKNFVRKRYLEQLAQQMAAGQTDEDAARRAAFRIFGSKPGSYGAGILPLIHEQNWQDETNFALAYVNWGGYAYGEQVYGEDARDEFKGALSGVQVAVKNQDNREHDIFDSDDYLQYHGGMIATIRALNGRNPKSYFGDNSDPERAEVRTLQQEAFRVFRSRVVNPKWIESIQRHGYKGALELSATVEYLFGYDATAQVVDDWMYEQTAQSYALDPAMQEFFQQSSSWALQSISERLLEAAQRGMWAEPNAETLAQLKAIYLEMDGALEERGEA